jgi:hypothetical protein
VDDIIAECFERGLQSRGACFRGRTGRVRAFASWGLLGSGGFFYWIVTGASPRLIVGFRWCGVRRCDGDFERAGLLPLSWVFRFWFPSPDFGCLDAGCPVFPVTVEVVTATEVQHVAGAVWIPATSAILW